MKSVESQLDSIVKQLQDDFDLRIEQSVEPLRNLIVMLNGHSGESNRPLNNLKVFQCLFCKKPFSDQKHFGRRRKFCSTKCAGDYRLGKRKNASTRREIVESSGKIENEQIPIPNLNGIKFYPGIKCPNCLAGPFANQQTFADHITKFCKVLITTLSP